MVLDPTQPADNETLSKLPYWIRNLTAAISVSGNEHNAYTITAGSTSITLSTVFFEVAFLTGAAAVSIQTLLPITAGTVKILIATDNNITLIDSAGNISLKGDPANLDLPMQAGDIIGLLYDSPNNTWIEMFRALV
jgi:hypothetical protein